MTIEENIEYLKYFGFKLTFFKTLNTFSKGRKGKASWLIHDFNNEIIEQYIKKICPSTYLDLCLGYYDDCLKDANYAPFMNHSVKRNDVIWTMWWQGEKNAPRIVKECIKSMRKHSKEHPVIVLDKNNYMDYIKLPEEIYKRFSEHFTDNTKLNKYTLNITQISDIIRMYLLYYYGGVWCDATMMFTADILDLFFLDEWNSLGQDDIWYIGRGKWSSFFMASRYGNGFIKYNYDTHIEYWQKQKYYVNYLMTDYIFDIASKTREKFAEMSNNVRCENKQCLTINRLYNIECEKSIADKFLINQYYHKLSWRWWGNTTDANCELFTKDGKITWLGYLLKQI